MKKLFFIHVIFLATPLITFGQEATTTATTTPEVLPIETISVSINIRHTNTILFSGTIKNVPMPALIGIMIAIAIKSGDWNSLYKKIDKNWIITVFTSLIGFFSGSLALGVVLGSLLHYNII